jgi:hypothetical protein
MRSNRLALLLLVAPTAFAHHSSAMFDVTKTVTLEGSIERYEWANPHVYIHLASSSGTWVVEAGSPSMMQRVGWTPDSFAVGDVVSIDVNPTRNAERLVEYFDLAADRTTLTYRFILEDSEYLAAPFESSAVWEHRPDLTYTAEECDLENARRYLEKR